MATIVFYEKPGCTGNARQKRLLRAAGHDLIVRDLLVEAWTPAKLRPYFGARPVIEWFNRNAPAVKSGDLDPRGFDESDALALLCGDPILIRRPLLQIGDLYSVGFETDTVAMLLGSVARHATEACPREDDPCPTSAHD
jgi:nitrogenase-associated protein